MQLASSSISHRPFEIIHWTRSDTRCLYSQFLDPRFVAQPVRIWPLIERRTLRRGRTLRKGRLQTGQCLVQLAQQIAIRNDRLLVAVLAAEQMVEQAIQIHFGRVECVVRLMGSNETWLVTGFESVALNRGIEHRASRSTMTFDLFRLPF